MASESSTSRTLARLPVVACKGRECQLTDQSAALLLLTLRAPHPHLDSCTERGRSSGCRRGGTNVRELDRRIATLRLRLAEINAREDQIHSLQRQFRSQLDKLMDFAVYDRGDLGSALSMAEEVDGRLAQAERTLRYLETIRARGQEELDALLLTGSIEAAKADVAELESQMRDLDAEIGRLQQYSSGDVEGAPGQEAGKLTELRARHEGLDAEIKRLRQAISEASDEAARAVAERASRAAQRTARTGG